MAVVETLLGRPPPPLNTLAVSEHGTETVWLVAYEQCSFWKSIDVDSCEPGHGTRHTRCLFGDLFDHTPGPRTQPPSLAGIVFNCSRNFLLTNGTEQLKMHRQVFIHSEEKLVSLPLLYDTAQFFEGQVASTLVVHYIPPPLPDRLLVRTLKKVMLSFSSCTNCELVFYLRAVSHSFRISGKLSVAPDQTMFNVHEEFRRLVRNNISLNFPALNSWSDPSLQCDNRLG